MSTSDFSFTTPQDQGASTQRVDGTKWNYRFSRLGRTMPYDATIYKDGATYYAYRNYNGNTIDSGTDIGVLLNSIESALGNSISIFVKNGTYNLTTRFRPGDYTVVVGESRDKTIIKTTAGFTTNQVLNETTNAPGNNGCGFINLTMDHSLASSGACINFTRVSNGIIHNCRFLTHVNSYAVFWTAETDWADYNYFTDNILHGPVGGLWDTFSGGKLRYSHINRNTVINGTGSAGIATRQSQYSEFNGNVIAGSEASGINLESILDCSCNNNVVFDVVESGIKWLDTATGGTPHGNEAVGNVIVDVKRGIECEGFDHVLSDNKVRLCSLTGISLTSENVPSGRNVLVGNSIKNVGTDTGQTANRRVGIRLNSTSDNVVMGNRVWDDQGTPTSVYGIVELGTADYNVIEGNHVRGMVTKGMLLAGANSIIRNNIGFVTENSGSATVASGATTQAVTHGLDYTPSINDIWLTPQGTWGSTTKWWPSTVTSTQFTINVDVAPGGSGLAFGWQVRRK